MVAYGDFSCASNTSAIGNIVSVTNIGVNAVPEFALNLVMNYISGCVSGCDAEDITSAFQILLITKIPIIRTAFILIVILEMCVHVTQILVAE